jgi:hypothetical protein
MTGEPNFGRACLGAGGLLGVAGLFGFVWTLGHDVSLPSGSPPFDFFRLGAGDWLTLLGLGLSFLAWGLAEAGWRRFQDSSRQLFYSIALIYGLLTLIVASTFATGTAVQRLQPVEIQAQRFRTLAALGRLHEVFGPGVIIANGAVAVTLLALSLQISQIPIRSERLRIKRLTLLRTPGVAEILFCLSREQKSIQEIQRHLPYAQSRRTEGTLERLRAEGWVQHEDAKVPVYCLTVAGAQASATLDQWLNA